MMGGFDDLFPDTLPPTYCDVDEARALAWDMLNDWFGALSYSHNESTHQEILDSLSWPGMPDFVQEASLHTQDWRVNFDEFAAGVRHQARLARRAGRVVPDGKPRVLRAPGGATGDLFGEDGEGEE